MGSLSDLWLYVLGTSLGREKVDASRLVDEFGPVREGFLDRTGFANLHRVGPGETGLTLATDALHMADSDWWTSKIDSLIYVTSTGDLVAPGNAHLLQSKLGLSRDLFLLDLNDACTGFVRSLFLAHSLIQSSAVETVLLVLSDTYSKLYDPSDLKVSPLFSDGASAIILSGVPLDGVPDEVRPRHWRVRGHKFISEGSHSGDLAIAHSVNERSLGDLSMNGGGVFNFVLKNLSQVLASLTSISGLEIEDVDNWYVHQGSRAVVAAVEKVVGADAGELFRSGNYGNTIGSSLPFQLKADEFDADSLGVIGLLAFGVGLTMGGVLVEQLSIQ